jgi:hypothetical protein
VLLRRHGDQISSSVHDPKKLGTLGISGLEKVLPRQQAATGT